MMNRSKEYKKQLDKGKTLLSKKHIEKHADRICYCHEYIGEA